MHVCRSAVSRLKNQKDCLLSTLRKYVGALGGTLEIGAVLPDGAVELDGLMRMAVGAEEQSSL